MTLPQPLPRRHHADMPTHACAPVTIHATPGTNTPQTRTCPSSPLLLACWVKGASRGQREAHQGTQSLPALALILGSAD